MVRAARIAFVVAWFTLVGYAMGIHQGVQVKQVEIVTFNVQTFSVNGKHLMKVRDQNSNGIVKRDCPELASGTWAFTMFQLAATVTAVGLFVISLNFAYNAIKASSVLNYAFAAGRAACANIATQGSVARTSTAALESAASAASAAKRWLDTPQYQSVPDQDGGLGDFPSQGVWGQGLNDLAGYVDPKAQAEKDQC